MNVRIVDHGRAGERRYELVCEHGGHFGFSPVMAMTLHDQAGPDRCTRPFWQQFFRRGALPIERERTAA